MRNAEKEEGEKPRQMIGMTGQFLGFKGRPLGRWEGESGSRKLQRWP